MIESNITDFSSMSKVRAKVDIYDGSTLVTTCTCEDSLQEFKINREGDTSKFFGFGVCHKLSVELIDMFNRLPSLSTSNYILISLGDGEIFDIPFPPFYISEITRDEKSNNITITAYDKLYDAAAHTFEELSITAPYTIWRLAEACANLLGRPAYIDYKAYSSFDTSYETGGNFEPTDTIRYVLNAIAEATQTIYFFNSAEDLVFKRLDKDGDALITITKDDYYELDTKTNRKLTTIVSATQLGDNTGEGVQENIEEATTGATGTTQYVRDNPLWELRLDLASLLQNAIDAVGNTTINQFNCEWSGDYRLEIGDKIGFITNDNSTITSYLLSDVIEYDGTLNEVTSWQYSEQDGETFANPTSLGEKLNQTFAKVDKANKTITMVASEVEGQSAQLATLELTTDTIRTKVNLDYENISKELETKVGATEVETIVTSKLTDIDKVITTTGKFDSTGLTISSSNADVSTNVNPDGLAIYRGAIHTEEDAETGQSYITNDPVLIVNNDGVKGENLQADTYLIIGNIGRFEYLDGRMCCYWLGE